jgi:hypothetical protein
MFASRRLDEAGDQPQGGGLAAARRSQQANELPVPDRQRHAIHRPGLAVALGQVLQFD